jgi:hypothetical protein
MGPKLLFVLGILLAHGAVGAAWLKDASPQPRHAVTACVHTPGAMPPGAMPDLSPRREILAMLVSPVSFEEPVRP